MEAEMVWWFAWIMMGDGRHWWPIPWSQVYVRHVMVIMQVQPAIARIWSRKDDSSLTTGAGGCGA